MRVDSARLTTLIPVEHGGYAMLLFPIASALLLTGFAKPSVLLALAFVLTFLSHRALLLVSGLRPAGDAGSAARWMLVATGTAVVLLALAALPDVPLAARWALLAPALGGCAFFRVLARHAERTAHGELLASIVLASCAIPVALAGGALVPEALTTGCVWVAGFAATSLAVRTVIERHRPARARLLVRAVLAVGGGATLALVALAAAGVVPPRVPLAQVPLAAIACRVALQPQAPRRLGSIGWSMVLASAITVGLLFST